MDRSRSKWPCRRNKIQEQDLNENMEEIAGEIEMPKERRSYSLHHLRIWG